MYADKNDRGLIQAVIGWVTLLVFAAAATLVPSRDVPGQTRSGPDSSTQESNSTGSHMSEALRSSVKKVVVTAGLSPANQAISGSYDKETPGLVGGMNAGSRIGTIPTEIGGVNVNFPIPILTIPGAIFGGLSGAAKREIQEFRDELTDELVKGERRALTNDGLALDVYRGLQQLPSLDSKLFAPATPIPEDTDAVLYVSFDGVAIDVQGKDAIITTSAKATLRRLSDGEDVYEKVARYQDRDTLSNWTKNENALWRDYVNFARHYLGREISAEVFDRIRLRHQLHAKETDTVARDRNDERQLVSRSLTPTLAWELTLEGDDSYGAWTDTIDESDIFYDVEIYDLHRLVYSEKQVPEPRHTIDMELDACQTYRWSVRPSYHVGGDIKFGEWMRFDPEIDTDTETDSEVGIIGRNASEAPAYIQDFALLKIKCGRR
ncbi:MAG: hypothetical protein ACE5OQ_05090 [Woeseia sp.]